MSESGQGQRTDVRDRPGAGAAVAQGLDDAAGRRPKSRNVKSLRRLLPFVANHKADAFGALVFLLLATAAMLGLSGAVRVLVDQITKASTSTGGGGITAASVDPWFLLLAGAAITLAAASALRYSSSPSWASASSPTCASPSMATSSASTPPSS
jgi:ATP-binding cassette subfamily B protein